ncbi:hypothetical protein LTR78_006777 [Recurvomyces mirabilis]|uniref:Uncharacterized protein n=1 Tax=Recurvomyces mirabilis TaxID=574656 RepID=A0AAE0WK79_9PEZI|nr:hypothetical protein LTR78_006777 [Recurvomyces mirabilis]KAK5153233.1 hypothetical protein LTS14_007878 [Recurvomyces mirabilis]
MPYSTASSSVDDNMVAGSSDVNVVGPTMRLTSADDAGDAGSEDGEAARSLDALVDNGTTSDPGRDDNSIGYRIETALSDVLIGKEDLISDGFKVQFAMALIVQSISKLQQHSILDKDAFVVDFLFRCDPSHKEDHEDIMYLTAITLLDLVGASSTKREGSEQFEGGEHFEDLVNQIRIGSECVDEIVEQALEKEDARGRERLCVQVEAWQVAIRDQYRQLLVLRSPYFKEDKVKLNQEKKTETEFRFRHYVPAPKHPCKDDKKAGFKSEATVETSSDDASISGKVGDAAVGSTLEKPSNAVPMTTPILKLKRKMWQSRDTRAAHGGDAADSGAPRGKQGLIYVFHRPSRDGEIRIER